MPATTNIGTNIIIISFIIIIIIAIIIIIIDYTSRTYQRKISSNGVVIKGKVGIYPGLIRYVHLFLTIPYWKTLSERKRDQ